MREPEQAPLPAGPSHLSGGARRTRRVATAPRFAPSAGMDCRIGVVAFGATASPELAAAIAALTAAGAIVQPAAQVADPAALDALLLAPATAALGRRAGLVLRHMLQAGKPIAAVGPGGLLALAAAGGARGVRLAAPANLAPRLAAAGAQPSERAAVADRGIVSGTGTAFLIALLREFAAELGSAPSRRRPPIAPQIAPQIAPPIRPLAMSLAGERLGTAALAATRALPWEPPLVVALP